jgi:sigma-E factor negative regulatory protein RseB
MLKRGTGVLKILLLVSFPALSAAAENPETWLEKMGVAVEHLNYEGTLVHMSPGKAHMYRIYHRVAEGEVTERLVEMDGAGAEIIRTNDEVICIFPAQQSVVVDKRANKGASQSPLEANLPAYSAALASHYRLAMLEPERIIDRSAVVVAIYPRDNLRYGYKLWLDSETGMPLKSQLIGDDESMPIEEIRFSMLATPEIVSADKVRTEQPTDDYQWTRHGNRPEKTQSLASINWQSRGLPAGFMQTAAMHEYMEGSANPRVHVVYSDGLASVSVFVDVGIAASEQVEGLSMMGAANAYSVMMEGMLVTAMGEVPPRTVELISQSMARQAP